MRTFTMEILTDGFTRAVLRKTGKGVISVEVDAEDMWDRDGLLKLSAALKSAAEMLPAE